MMTKKEQLKAAFRTILKDMMNKLGGNFSIDGDIEKIVANETSELLLKEVSIRTPLRWGGKWKW